MNGQRSRTLRLAAVSVCTDGRRLIVVETPDSNAEVRRGGGEGAWPDATLALGTDTTSHVTYSGSVTLNPRFLMCLLHLFLNKVP